MSVRQPSVPQFTQQRSGMMLIHTWQELVRAKGGGQGRARQSVLLPQEKTLMSWFTGLPPAEQGVAVFVH